MSGSYVDTAKVDLKYLNDVNDAEAGSWIASAVQPRFGGVLGKILQLTDAEALRLSDIAIGTLFGGEYQYVLTKTGSTAAPARGTLAFWDTLANAGATGAVVTPDVTATNITQVAGIYLSAPTKGNYCFIQVWGRATAKYLAAVTDTTIGDIVFVDVTPTNTVDANTPAAATAAQQAKKIGIAYEAPANAGLKQIWLQRGGALCPNFR